MPDRGCRGPGTVAASTADGGGPTVTAPGEADGQGERRRAVRWWLIAPLAAVAVVLAVAVAWKRWDLAPVHGARPFFSRTTSEGIDLDVQAGEVRLVRIVCRTEDPTAQCVSREPGIAVTTSLPDGRTGGFTVPDAGFAPPGTASTTAPSLSARVLLTAGLGIAPGSEDEQVVVVRAGPGIARVRATRRDGSVDEMAPVDGWVVLATRSGWASGWPMEAIDTDGRVVPLR